MKKVLGLDLGVASIGWALVNQAENENEKSSIIKIGVRVNPLTSDEKQNFTAGKTITTNADRRDKRSKRRNLQRYHLRRDNLIELLKNSGWIDNETLLSENGNKSTFETYKLRAKAVEEEISLSELARVLLMINKKRGYKSNRKAKGKESGTFLDDSEISKILYEKYLTPGEYSLSLLANDKKNLPDFYPSDLQAELDRIWNKQKIFYPELLTDDFRKDIQGRGTQDVTKLFNSRYQVFTAENKGKQRKIQSLEWRVRALSEKIEIDVLAYIIANLSGAINSSSSYLGNISDRSKKLYINGITIGQYLYNNLMSNPHFSIKNNVFYRLDYLDEFERIWEKQKTFHNELTPELKTKIRDNIIFYQRRLKSQKYLVSYCNFEPQRKVAPKSSIFFQEFKIWQTINNLSLTNTDTGEIRELSIEEKIKIAQELQVKKELDSKSVFDLIIDNKQERREYELNYNKLQGNITISEIFEKFLEICDIVNQKDSDYKKLSANEIKSIIKNTFTNNGYNCSILDFDTSLNKKDLEKQPLFKLWHLLYSYENDNSATGDHSLIQKISELLNMPEDLARIVSTISFTNDYASLSHHAISKILPFLKQGYIYDKACMQAGYKHSESSLTKEEIDNKELVVSLKPIPKNSLRNPVVEKILNQMINVINALDSSFGKPDEIHIEMARELKQNQKQREVTSKRNDQQEKDNANISELLKKAPFNLKYVSKSDIVKYRLYEELKLNGYKTLYSGKYISKEELFSRKIDIEHIIPQAIMFNDSYSNKTLEFREINQEKDKMTALDYVTTKGNDLLEQYKRIVNELYRSKAISRSKKDFLLMDFSHVPDDFLNRDLSNTQYIAREARNILEQYVKVVMPTTGGITSKLREDWQLVDVMKELNLPKYEKAGLVAVITDKDGNQKLSIKDWSKREDHRHHAMDALTIAFTKPSYIQYLNNIKAKSDKNSAIYGIATKETKVITNGTKKKRIFIPPMPLDELRNAFKNELETLLVSVKAKNKVVTQNINKSKNRGGYNKKIQLTPRGRLHAEQIYGLRKRYKTELIPIKKIDLEKVNSVASEKERNALIERLMQFNGDPKKAFCGKNSPDKNPIWLDKIHSKQVGDKVKCVELEIGYSIRKEINKDISVNSVNKVIDSKCRKLLEERLKGYDNNPKTAFANLDANPIWLNKEKGIKLKRISILESFPGIPLHHKKDKEGKTILNDENHSIPTDYVNPKNNHHVAIYRNAEGNLEEIVVTFMEVLERKIKGEPIINKEYNKDKGWVFLFSMKINEMFVFPNKETYFDPTIIDLKNPANNKLISPNLYRVQSVSKKDYWFRHHHCSKKDDTKELKNITWKRVKSINELNKVIKVRIDHIGNIVDVGEYD